MTYICVGWKHQSPDEPVTIYSELDDNRFELRKVEVFRNGSCGYASVDGATGGTSLGLEPVPSLREIANDPQFDPTEITVEEFEIAWRGREGR